MRGRDERSSLVMNDLPYWGIAAIKVWICTRELSYVQERLTGDARRDEKHVWDVLAEFVNGELRPKVGDGVNR